MYLIEKVLLVVVFTIGFRHFVGMNEETIIQYIVFLILVRMLIIPIVEAILVMYRMRFTYTLYIGPYKLDSHCKVKIHWISNMFRRFRFSIVDVNYNSSIDFRRYTGGAYVVEEFNRLFTREGKRMSISDEEVRYIKRLNPLEIYDSPMYIEGVTVDGTLINYSIRLREKY